MDGAGQTLAVLDCPRCGGPMSALDGAAAVVCPHCAERFFLGDDGSVGWLIQPQIPFAQALETARKYLRESGHRVTRIGEPRGVLVPVYWVRGMRFIWTLAEPEHEHRHELEEREGLFARRPDPGEPSGWEPRITISAYAHVLPAHPLGDAMEGLHTRLQSLSLAVLDPDRLPAGYELLVPTRSPSDGREAAQRWMVSRERSRGWGEEKRAAHDLQLRVNIAAVPLILVPFEFRAVDRGEVLVDALTGEPLGESKTGAKEPPLLGSRAAGRPQLLPLECPECGAQLSLNERDRIFPCTSCYACWEMVGGERRRLRQWFHEGPIEGPGRWLPFWVFGSRASEDAPPEDAVYVPAFEGRHPEALLHLAADLARRRPHGTWSTEPVDAPMGAAVGSEEAVGWRWAVAGALSRRNLAGFLEFIESPPARFGAPAGLAWLRFHRLGADLVEVKTGARLRAISAVPWETRRAA